MKKLSSAAVAAALSMSLLTAPGAVAVEDGGSSSSSSATSVTRNQDNAGAIPDKNYTAPEQPSLGSAYTGSAPVSLFLMAAGIAAVFSVVAQYPPIAKELKKITARWSGMRRQLVPDLRK